MSRGGTTLYVTGFGPSMRARELAYEFERYGRLVRCDIPAPRTASSRVFAFVEYESRRDADDAYHEMHNTRVGRDRETLKIEWARTPPSASWRFDAGRPGRRSPRRRSGSPAPRRRYDDDRDRDYDRERDYDRRDRGDKGRSRSPDARDRSPDARDRDRDHDMKDRDREDRDRGDRDRDRDRDDREDRDDRDRKSRDREDRDRDEDRDRHREKEHGANGDERKDRDEPPSADDLDIAE